MTEAKNNRSWAQRLTRIALLLSVGGVLAALAGAIGSGAGLWHFGTGFAVLKYAFYAAIAGGLLAILAFILSRRSGERTGGHNLAAVLIALLFAAYLLPQIATAKRLPGIHDISTDLADVPQFAVLPMRADNLDKVPDEGRPELAAMAPEERWKALHRQAYGELRPLRTSAAPAEALRKAEALAKARGWAIAKVDPAKGTVEATATTLFFRFKDDVVIRVRPDRGAAGGSIVDMRSISQVGGSDVGVNAERIRAFLTDLEASLKRAA